MDENKPAIATDLARLDAHVIQPEEYDDIPEWTDETFARAIYRMNGVEVPLPPRRGRPPSDRPKVHTRLRIDPDILDHFKAAGPGWQTRINAALRDAMTRAR